MRRSAGGQAFCDELDRLVRATFTTDYWEISLPNLLDTSAAKSPVLSAYQAALNLLDAEALFSDLKLRDLLDPAVVAPRSVERHHLFPKAHLATLGVTGNRNINAIANMAYLDWPDNATIAAQGPATYWQEITARLDPDRLQRQTYWHALPVGWEQLDYATFCERRRTLLARVVRDGFNILWEDDTPVPATESIFELLRVGESQTVEFKSTARWNLHAGRPDKRLEHVIAKTVCGFLNSQGGKLLIGVDDGGSVVGLGSDLQTLHKKDKDGYELFLRQMLDDALSTPTAGIVRIGFENSESFEHAGSEDVGGEDVGGENVGGENVGGDGLDVCVVSVSSSGKPVFAKPHEGGAGHSEFWVRIGNATRQLHGEDMEVYKSNHWN
ncbi:MAG: putative DNA binding domain-containing protein [Acidimicrobiaceae bacterium]|nr:putative DNA binding domain-containing protein [Acidimicrobiaceae bacterium]MCY4280892.1 putative DNA binding domain-containing protein [Acidimicrobiaceae bacterium]